MWVGVIVRERERESKLQPTFEGERECVCAGWWVSERACVCVCESVCECVCRRERGEREVGKPQLEVLIWRPGAGHSNYLDFH